MTFPSLSSAEDYLKEKLQDFYDQGQVLNDRIIGIGKLLKIARDRNDQQALGQLTILKAQAQDLFMEHLQLRETLSPFGSYFGVNMTLGFLPLILAATAIAAAGALYLFYEKMANQKKALDLVAQGLMTPAEAQAILEPSFLSSLVGGGMVSMLPIALIAGYFLFVRR